MNKTKLSWTISNIEKMADQKQTLSFDHPIQRRSEIWTNFQKSLLIHSLLSNFPVPHIYVLREDSKEVDKSGKPVFNYFVLDGKQRLTSVLSYIWGEFELSENIPNIKIEDEEYEIAGKYFVDLDKNVQFEIMHYKFDIIAFEECSNREVEEIFLRLNNGTALSKSEISKAKSGLKVASLLNELLASKFIKESCFFTKSQVAKSEDQRCVLQAMMLFHRNYVPNFTFKDFSEQEILQFSESLNGGNYTEKQSDVIKSAIEFLNDVFSDKNKHLKKITVPMVIYLADYAIDKEISPRYFCKWFSFFTEKDETYADYKFFGGGTGSTKLEKVDLRLTIMAKSFCKFCDLDLPAELADLVSKTDKLLEERKALADTENTITEDSATPEQTSDKEESENVIPFAKEELTASDTADQKVTEETGTADQEETVTSDEAETSGNEAVTSEAETSGNETDQAEDEAVTEDITSNAE